MGFYCGSDAMIDGQNVGSCLGDLFSIARMEDREAVDVTSETLDAQFMSVRTRTTKSKVLQWGTSASKPTWSLISREPPVSTPVL